jgi:hypothetical protein
MLGDTFKFRMCRGFVPPAFMFHVPPAPGPVCRRLLSSDHFHFPLHYIFIFLYFVSPIPSSLIFPYPIPARAVIFSDLPLSCPCRSIFRF